MVDGATAEPIGDGHPVGRRGPLRGHPVWCSPQHCYVTDDGVRVHQSAPTRDADDASWVETQLISSDDESDTYLELLVRDVRFGREVPPFLELATAGRLRDRLSAYLAAAEPSESAPDVR